MDGLLMETKEDKHKRHLLMRKIWREKNKEKIKEYRRRYYQRRWLYINKKNREYHEKNRKKLLKTNLLKRARYIKKHPEKIKSQNLAQKIPLKLNCEICNSNERLERHHWDYNKPLIVITLCKDCHTAQHIKNLKGGILTCH